MSDDTPLHQPACHLSEPTFYILYRTEYRKEHRAACNTVSKRYKSTYSPSPRSPDTEHPPDPSHKPSTQSKSCDTRFQRCWTLGLQSPSDKQDKLVASLKLPPKSLFRSRKVASGEDISPPHRDKIHEGNVKLWVRCERRDVGFLVGAKKWFIISDHYHDNNDNRIFLRVCGTR